MNSIDGSGREPGRRGILGLLAICILLAFPGRALADPSLDVVTVFSENLQYDAEKFPSAQGQPYVNGVPYWRMGALADVVGTPASPVSLSSVPTGEYPLVYWGAFGPYSQFSVGAFNNFSGTAFGGPFADPGEAWENQTYTFAVGTTQASWYIPANSLQQMPIPQNIAITGGTKPVISWDPVAGADGYNIWILALNAQGNPAGGSASLRYISPVTTQTSLPYDGDAFAAGGSYAIRVNAVQYHPYAEDPAYQGRMLNRSSYYTRYDVRVTPPDSLTLPANNADGNYTVSWTESLEGGATYTLEEATDAGFTANVRTVYSGTELTAEITGRTSGLTYYYRVKAAKDGAFAESEWRTAEHGCAVDSSYVEPSFSAVMVFSENLQYDAAKFPAYQGLPYVNGVPYWRMCAHADVAGTRTGPVSLNSVPTGDYELRYWGLFGPFAQASVGVFNDYGPTPYGGPFAGPGTSWENQTYTFTMGNTQASWFIPENSLRQMPIPQNVVITGGTKPVISWDPVAGADSYIVWITSLGASGYPGTLPGAMLYFSPASGEPSVSYDGDAFAAGGSYAIRVNAVQYHPYTEDPVYKNRLLNRSSYYTRYDVRVTPPASLTLPANDADGSYTVSWTESLEGGATYTLEEATDAGFTANLRTAYSGPALAADITGRTSGLTYYYRVKAGKGGAFADSVWRIGEHGCAVHPIFTSVSVYSENIQYDAEKFPAAQSEPFVNGVPYWHMLAIADVSGTPASPVSLSSNPTGDRDLGYWGAFGPYTQFSVGAFNDFAHPSFGGPFAAPGAAWEGQNYSFAVGGGEATWFIPENSLQQLPIPQNVVVTGGTKPIISWDPVAGADNYGVWITVLDGSGNPGPLPGSLLFLSRGTTQTSLAYDGSLLAAGGSFAIRVNANQFHPYVGDPNYQNRTLNRSSYYTRYDVQVSPPASLTFPASDVDGSYSVSWTESPEGGATYFLEEATDAGFTAGLRTVYSGTALTAAVTGRVNGVTYYYRVKARKGGAFADSSWRDGAHGCAVAYAAVNPPFSITVPATDADGAYSVSWAASPNTAVTYVLEEATNDTFTAGLRTAYTGTALTFAITARPSGATYCYRVKARKTGGWADSAWQTLNALGEPGLNGCAVTYPTVATPGNITVPTADLDGAYSVTWTASATAGSTYVLEEATNDAFTAGLRTAYTGAALTAAIAGRPSGATYFYRVKAKKTGAWAESGWVTGAAGCTVTFPQVASPGSITVPGANATGAYSVSWTASSTASPTYVLEEATNDGFTAGLRTAYTGTALTAAITARPSGATYFYRVKAKKAGAFLESGWQAGVNGCAVKYPTVATPGSLTVPATDADGAYSVSWTASTTPSPTYVLEEATNDTFTAGLRTAYTGTAMTAAITARPNGATYYYRVKAKKTGAFVESGWQVGGNGCAVTYPTVAVPGSIMVPAADADGAFSVTWTAPTTAGSTYVLEEATNDAFTAGLRTAYAGSALTAAITARPNGATYYYRVKAKKTGAFLDSSWQTGTNGCAVTYPTVAASGSITVPATDSDGAFSVTWTASVTAGSTYVLEEATNDTCTANLRTAYAGTALTASITARPNGGTYYYRVKAKKSGSFVDSAWQTLNSLGQSGFNGCKVMYPTVAAPGSITVPAASSTGACRVSWTASTTAAPTYVLEEATNDTFTAGLRTAYTGTALTAAITGRVSGVTYYYRVKAKKAGAWAESGWVTGAAGCTVTFPQVASPGSITVPAASANGACRVSWTASTTAAPTYVLEEATNDTFTAGLRTAYTGTALTAAITGRANGVTYYYRVKAKKAGAFVDSPWRASAAGCAVNFPPAAVPGSIAVPAADTDGRYVVSWTASSTASSTYVLEEATDDIFLTNLRTVYTGTALTATITDRTIGETYYYRVKARKAGLSDSACRVAANGCVVNVISTDMTAPVVKWASIWTYHPGLATSPVVSLSFSATDNVGVTGYWVSTSSDEPDTGASGWAQAPPNKFTFSGEGRYTLYGWAKDGAGNVSARADFGEVVVHLPVQFTVCIDGPPTCGYGSIQEAIDASSDGDWIWVSEGTYRENISYRGKYVSVRSAEGPGLTVIDGGGAGSVVVLDGYQATLTGFTVTNGAASMGGGVVVSQSSVISSCEIVGNTAETDGGGIYAYGSHMFMMEGVLVAGNSAGHLGGGVYIAAPYARGAWPDLTNCTVSGNRAGIAGGGLALENCYGNITYSTVAGNLGDLGGGIYASGDSLLSLTNVILWGNEGAQGANQIHEVDVAQTTTTSCDVEGGWPGSLDVEPLFVAPVGASESPTAGGNYHLQEGSGCIDQGTNVGYPSWDIDGNARPWGSGVDIGSDEFVP